MGTTQEKMRPLLFLFTSDPDITTPIIWPSGTYALIQVADQPGWLTGCRYEDTEDKDPSLMSLIQGEFHSSSIKMCYCNKAQPDTSIFHWPKGSYCIARQGDTCPEPEFSSGYIYWDDEDKDNSNYVENLNGLPDGSYDTSTKIYFCCRQDGETDEQIVLPSEKDFILYSAVLSRRMSEYECQEPLYSF